jgi:glycerol-3-phosphate dehydrogenase
VWGGKITTFRKLAEEAADLLQRRWACSGRPGPNGASARRRPVGLDRRAAAARHRHRRFVPSWRAATRTAGGLAARWARAYGSARATSC